MTTYYRSKLSTAQLIPAIAAGVGVAVAVAYLTQIFQEKRLEKDAAAGLPVDLSAERAQDPA